MSLLSDFSEVIASILNNWTALNLAIEHGMGGTKPVVDEKLGQLVAELSKMCSDDKCGWDECACTLEDRMDEYFDLLIEDGSADEIAKVSRELWMKWCAGEVDYVRNYVNSLPNNYDIIPIHLRSSQINVSHDAPAKCARRSCAPVNCAPENCVSRNCTSENYVQKNCAPENCAIGNCAPENCILGNCAPENSILGNCAPVMQSEETLHSSNGDVENPSNCSNNDEEPWILVKRK